jgi:hypothetical protein
LQQVNGELVKQKMSGFRGRAAAIFPQPDRGCTADVAPRMAM